MAGLKGKKEVKNEELKKLLDENSGVLYNKAVCCVNKNGESCFQHNINCDIDAVFDLASVSKILTGTMLFRLIGEGKLSLEQNLNTLFEAAPLGPVTKERFKTITLQSLLTHSSGLLPWFPFYTQKDSFWNVLELVLNKYPVQDGMAYSDPGFMLLGEAIISASGLSLPENLDLLNQEMGTSFTYNPQNPKSCVETERGNRIEKAMCEERGLEFNGFRDFENNICGKVNDGNAFYFWQGVAGHAGIFGTARDLIKLGELYRRFGEIKSRNGVIAKQLIPSALVEKSTVDYGNNRGLMWALSDIFINGYGHTGFTGTSLYICPKAGIVAAILTNRLVIEPAPDLKAFRLQAHKIISGCN